MSEINKLTQADLTLYTVDGLELFFTNNRKVRASQSAIARMCSTEKKTISQSQIGQLISRLVKNGEIKSDVVSVEIRSGVAPSRHLLHGSETIVACLDVYNSSRLKDFTSFGIDEGLAQMAGVPLPQPTETLSAEDQLILMATEAINMAKIRKAAKANPGDERVIESVLKPSQPILEGKMTVYEMAQQAGITLDKTECWTVGTFLAGSVKCRKEEKEITKVRRRYKDGRGFSQSIVVNNYPVSFYPNFLSACAAIGKL
jgi:hypothetical protein